MTTLEDALKRYDGKATSILSEARATFGERRTFLSELVRLSGHDEPNVSDGATWLIKASLEDGVRLSPSQIEELIGRLDAISSWPAQLHICQSAEHLEVSAHQANACADWLTPLLISDRPFLRAWSMNALQHLAKQNPTLAERAMAALSAAENDSAASVRARARKWRR